MAFDPIKGIRELRDRAKNVYNDVGVPVGFAAYNAAFEVLPNAMGGRSQGKVSNIDLNNSKDRIDEIASSIAEISKNTKIDYDNKDITGERRKLSREEVIELGIDPTDINQFSQDNKDYEDSEDVEFSYDRPIPLHENKKVYSENDVNEINKRRKLDRELKRKNENINNKKTKLGKKVNLSLRLPRNNEDKLISDINYSRKTLYHGTTNLMKVNSKGFSLVTSQVNIINNINAAGTFNKVKMLGNIIESIDNSVKNQTKQSVGNSMSNEGLASLIRGDLSLGSYFKAINDTLTKSPHSLTNVAKNGLKNIAKAPLQFALSKTLTQGIKLLDNKDFIGRMNELVNEIPVTLYDKSKNGELGGILNKIPLIKKLKSEESLRIENIPLLGKLVSGGRDKLKDLNIDELIQSKIFGPGSPFSDIMDGEISTANIANKDSQVRFDAETHNTINVVITGYLSRIYEALSGKRLVNDYSTGKWMDEIEFRKTLDDRYKDRLSKKQSKLLNAIRSSVLDNDEDKINDIYKTFADKDIRSISDFSKLYDKYSPNSLTMKRLLQNIDEDTLSGDVRRAQMIKRANMEYHNVSGSSMNYFNEDEEVSKLENSLVRLSDRDKSNITFKNSSINLLKDTNKISLDILNIIKNKFNGSNPFNPKEDDPNGDNQIEIKEDSSKAESSSKKELDEKESELNESSKADSSIKDEISEKLSDGEESSLEETGGPLDALDDIKDTIDDISPEMGKKFRSLTDSLKGKITNSNIFKKLTSNPKVSSLLKSFTTGGKSGLLKNAAGMIGSSSLGLGAKSLLSNIGGKATSLLGKVGGSKIASKIGGKFAGKALGKTAAKLLGFTNPIGIAINIATSLPEIMSVVKHPIESLKHPLKTIGSFFGLTSAPGEDLENGTSNKSTISGPSFLTKMLMGAIGGAASLFSLSNLLLRVSPIGILSGLGNSLRNTVLSKSSFSIKNEKAYAESLFGATTIGSLYNLASGVNSNYSFIGAKFEKLFSAVGGKSSSSSESSVEIITNDSSSTSSNSGSSSSSYSNKTNVKPSTSTGSTSNSGSQGSSSATSSSSGGSSSGGSSSASPSGGGNNNGGSSTGGSSNSGGQGSSSATSSSTEDNINGMVNGGDKNSSISNIIKKIIYNNYYNTSNMTINNYFGKSKVEGNKDDYDKDSYLIMMDISKLVDSIGEDFINIDSSLDEIIENLIDRNNKYEKSNDIKDKSKDIATTLVTLSNF